MCGICGLARAGGGTSPADRDAVAAMVAAMRHRGPNDRGIAATGEAVLGMTRLAIQDLSPAGHQPMVSEDGGITLVFNGEIYNFRELRAWLQDRGHCFRSQGDTEVLLRLYEEQGEACLPRLRGMFALAVLDRRPGRETVLVARDPFGIKPLLYQARGETLVFASELKALLASGQVERAIDPEGVRLLLTYGAVRQPATLLRDVRMLPPGHLLRFADGRIALKRYFSLRADRPELAGLAYPEQVEALDALLRETVRLQMISDVPVGAFLSGGLDSALLCALMLRAGVSDLNTFSVGFSQEGEAIDESADALATAAHLGVRHHPVVVDGREAAAHLPDIVRDLDQPSVDGVNSWFVSRAARSKVTVALSGTGGDELFAGYPWFAESAAWQTAPPARWRRERARLLSLPCFDALAPGRLGPWLEERRIDADFLSFYAQRYYIFGPTGAARLLAPGLRRTAGAGRAMRRDLAPTDELAAADPFDRVSALCLRGYTGNQLLRDIDCVSMAHSLEVRVPYLDPVVAGAALSLPMAAKLSGRRPETYADGLKRILLDVAKPFLPADFATRRKRGFGMPFGSWLRGPLRAVFDDALSPAGVRAGGLLDPGAVAAVKADFEAGRIQWMKPWLLLVFELWRRDVLRDGGRP